MPTVGLSYNPRKNKRYSVWWNSPNANNKKPLQFAANAFSTGRQHTTINPRTKAFLGQIVGTYNSSLSMGLHIILFSWNDIYFYRHGYVECFLSVFLQQVLTCNSGNPSPGQIAAPSVWLVWTQQPDRQHQPPPEYRIDRQIRLQPGIHLWWTSGTSIVKIVLAEWRICTYRGERLVRISN